MCKCFIQKRKDSDYFLDFYLNFGNNDLLISNNIKLDNESITDPTVLVKLYEPLPGDLQTKDTLWFSEQVSDPFTFKVDINIIPDEEEDDVRPGCGGGWGDSGKHR